MGKKTIKDIFDDFNSLIWDGVIKIKDGMVDFIPKTPMDFLDLSNLVFCLFLFFISFWFFRVEFKFLSSRQKQEGLHP